MLVALLLSLQTVAAPTAGGDVLDELIAKTSGLKSFTAIYEMTVVKTGEPPESAQVEQFRIDFQGPNKTRFDMSVGSDHMSQWWIDGVYAMRTEGAQAAHGRIDLRAIGGETAPLDRMFRSAFPDAQLPSCETRPIIYMGWSFDEAAQQAAFAFDVRLAPGATQLSWLTGLRQQGGKLTRSGGHLLWDSDGHSKFSISENSGFVETVDGKSPSGDMHLELKSLTCDEPIDPQRFDLTRAPSEGSDVSEQLRHEFLATSVKNLRDAIYSRIAGTTGDAWTDSERAKISELLRAYHEYAMKDVFDPLRKNAKQTGERAAAALKKRLDDGHSVDEVAADREGLIGKLNESLDKQSNYYSSACTVPEHVPPFPRGEELLKLEREVASKAFDEFVRAPIVRDFEQATALEKK